MCIRRISTNHLLFCPVHMVEISFRLNRKKNAYHVLLAVATCLVNDLLGASIVLVCPYKTTITLILHELTNVLMHQMASCICVYLDIICNDIQGHSGICIDIVLYPLYEFWCLDNVRML